MRLDFKDEMIKKITLHSQYLFSDIVLTSRTNLIASTDRFLSLFNLPEYDGIKKSVSLK
jgi:hypothetical protein